jgi:methionyl aminopeptidase
MDQKNILMDLGSLHSNCQRSIQEWLDQHFLTSSTIKTEHLADFIESSLLSSLEPIAKKYHTSIFGLPFPAMISKNNIAAHCAPTLHDKETISPNDLIKIDFGVHVKGYLIDSAFSYSQDPVQQHIIHISKEATQIGANMIRIDQRLTDIGKEIQECIESYDNIYSLYELSGHSIDRYNIHAGQAVPNCYVPNYNEKVKSGLSYAVETFPTTGTGKLIHSPKQTSISKTSFMIDSKQKIPSSIKETIVWKHFKSFDFTPRTLFHTLQTLKLESLFVPTLKFIQSSPYYVAYPPLYAEPRPSIPCIVAQVETNIWVDPINEHSTLLVDCV